MGGEFDLDSLEREMNQYGSSRSGINGRKVIVVGFLLLVGITAVALSITAFSTWSVRQTPEYAVEEWFTAVWDFDGDTMLDRTCDEQIWLANAINLGGSTRGVVEFLGISSIPFLDDLPLDIELQNLRGQFGVDLTHLHYESTAVSETEVIVMVSGQMRFQIFGGRFAAPLTDQWVARKEYDSWKWCGRAN